MTTNLDQIGPNPCPHCGGVYGDHNETCDFTVDSLNRSSELTPTQRVICLLALLDEIIKKDEERTQGEWQNTYDEAHDRWSVDVWFSPFHGQNIGRCGPLGEHESSFIASASVSHGRNARALKVTIMALQDTVDHADSRAANMAWDKMIEISKIYPDEILKRYF